MIEDRIITIMSAFNHIDDKFESLKLLIDAKMIDINCVKDYNDIIHHLISNAECNNDIDTIAKGLVSIFGSYMVGYNSDTDEISTLHDFISDGHIDLISEYGIIVRNDFLRKLEYYGCISILELPDQEVQNIVHLINDEEEL